jgi:hypothetical protein
MKSTRVRIFIGAILVCLLCGLYVFLSLNGLSYQKSLVITPQANITIIPGPAIPTPDFALLLAETQTPTVNPFDQNGSGIRVGVYVQITGTGGSGLNIRSDPQLSSAQNFIANDSEVFLVIGGPVSQDSYTWWQLSAPYDQSRQGWAVDTYLHLITPQN